jgi:hypothetical protein
MIADRNALRTYTDGNDCIMTFDGDTPAVGTAQLLLDADGKLVGVDLGGPGFSRVAIMIGAHEDVAAQRPARVQVNGNELRVLGAASLVR